MISDIYRIIVWQPKPSPQTSSTSLTQSRETMAVSKIFVLKIFLLLIVPALLSTQAIIGGQVAEIVGTDYRWWQMIMNLLTCWQYQMTNYFRNISEMQKLILQ